MYNVIITSLEEWNAATDSRKKLQHAYIVAALALLLLAGIIGLINYDLGQRILFVAIVAAAMFIINAVAWALLQSFVLLRIGARHVTTTATKATVATKKSVKKK